LLGASLVCARLASAGVLEAADDVFYLRLAELEAIDDVASMPSPQLAEIGLVARMRITTVAPGTKSLGVACGGFLSCWPYLADE
jgi:hypothetical protein